MLFQRIFIYSLLTFGVMFAATVDAVIKNRSKRSPVFGVFLKNILQNSADLSNNSSPPRRPPMMANTTRAPSTTTTSTTTTVAPPTTEAPPMMPPPFLQKSFYKVIPGVGRIGIGFGLGGNLRNPPFFYSYDSEGGYIDFDYNDNIASSPPPSSSSTTTTTSTTTSTTTTEAPTMTTEASTTQLAPTRRKPQPMQNIQRRPVPQINTQGRRVIYQYIPGPYFNAQTPPQLNYNYFGQYNEQQRSQLPSYDNPNSYNTLPIPTVPLVRPKPTSLPTTSARPIIVSQNSAFNSRTQLSDNLIYQFAPNNDIYSRDGTLNANEESVAGNSDGETFDDAADANEAVSDGSVDYAENDNSFDVVDAATASADISTESSTGDDMDDVATSAPNVQQRGYDEFNSPSDISGPFNFQINAQNHRFSYNNQKNEFPYSIKSAVPRQGLFVYSNHGPKSDRLSRGPLPIERNSQSFASMGFRSPFANFHTSTVNNGYKYNGQQHQPYEAQLKYYK